MININGKSYSGRNITISKNRVIVNGKDVTPDAKEIKIAIQGDVDVLNVDACKTVYVEGDVGKVKTMSGDVKIKGNIIAGSVNTMSGNVTCLNIAGGVKTMTGNIKYNKKTMSGIRYHTLST